MFLLVFLTEILAISFSVDARVLFEESCTELFCGLAYAGNAVKIIVLTAVLAGIVINRDLKNYLSGLIESQTSRRRLWMVIQLSAFALFYVLSQIIFQEQSVKSDFSLIWIALGVACGALFLLAVASGTFWLNLLLREKRALTVAFCIACLTFTLSTLSADLWHPLSDATFFVSASFLELTGLEVFRVPDERLLGVGRFIVNVAPSCSGYEGIGLITAFSAAYLYFFRNEFIFPRAFILFPIGIVCIWIFNAIRIAALIYIGHVWSPEVAVGGFHSQAGWISFIICALGILWLAHSSNFYTRAEVVNGINKDPNVVSVSSASLIPMLVLLGSNLVISAFSTEFDYLYPLKVVFLSLSIIYIWKAIASVGLQINFEPVFAAALVSGVWLLLVPVDHVYNAQFSQSLHHMSGVAEYSWLGTRMFGAIILIPIAEELGFRGYLLCKIDRKEVVLHGPLFPSIAAIFLSSLVFGLMHDAWIAGTIAGVVYAILRIRNHSIHSAIVSHMLTNAILFTLAVSFGWWHLL